MTLELCIELDAPRSVSSYDGNSVLIYDRWDADRRSYQIVVTTIGGKVHVGRSYVDSVPFVPKTGEELIAERRAALTLMAAE